MEINSEIDVIRIGGSNPLEDWLRSIPETRGIHRLSKNQSFDHPEEDYDNQYGHSGEDLIEKTIGSFILNAAGFVPEQVLEVACGTGHLTASLLFDGRIKRIVASDASEKFLRITKSKVDSVPRNVNDSLNLLLLSDSEFNLIPPDVFDGIMMRSALHHFLDFKSVAKILIEKLRPGGGLFLLEPRADFHIASSLMLMSAKTKAVKSDIPWTDLHEYHVNDFINSAEFYLSRDRDKSSAEDKFVFFLDEMLEISESTGTTLKRLGGEYCSNFTTNFRDFMHYCMKFDSRVLSDVMALLSAELDFMDHTYKSQPRYAAAEWLLFRRT